jgi:phosphoenolpyruvate carboxykinase (GTP)
LDLEGLTLCREEVENLIKLKPEEWAEEIRQVRQQFESYGKRFPAAIKKQV